MVVGYAPHDLRRPKDLSDYCGSSAEMFNTYIANAGALGDVPLENRSKKGGFKTAVCLILNTPFTYLGTRKWEATCPVNKLGRNLFDKVGNGETTKFWDDIWIGSKPLKLLFPRIYALDNIKDASICMKLNEPSLDNNFRRSIRGGIEQSQFKKLTDLLIPIVLNPCPDRWFWSLEGSGEFSVASIRRFIDDQRLLTVDSKTLWIKSVPIKVNILAWKIKLEALPTRFNISRRDKLRAKFVLGGISNIRTLTPSLNGSAGWPLYVFSLKPHGRMILASVEKGPLVWPSITVDGVTRLKEYIELTPAEAIQADCDIKAINIILQGLPTEIYALVSQHRVAKDLWEKIKLLMQGTSLTKQERECKLYDEFDKFTYKKGESLHEYYLRFALLLNDMNIYKMPLEQFQVNTNFLNTLPDEWSKFVTDVKLGRQTTYAAGTTRKYTPGTSGSNTGKQQTIIYLGLPDIQTSQTVITHNAAYQANDLDAYDSDSDELNSAKIGLMANLSRNGSDALTEEILVKMLLKEQDPLVVKHRVNTKPINYAILNNDYNKRFVRQSDLYSEHAYWKATSVPASDPSHSSTTITIEVPKELPTVSIVYTLERAQTLSH
ncbi:hypothetical protein Tco_0817086 [Tanacetum coccineum]